MEIVPGLHRLQTPMTSHALPWVMPYAFEGDGGVSLFDSGYGTPEAIASLTDQLDALGYRPSQVRRLIVSHAHPDHLGMAGWLKEQSPDLELMLLDREATWFRDFHHGAAGFMERTGRWLARHGVDAGEAEAAFRQMREAGGERAAARGEAAAPPGGNDLATETERRSWGMPDVRPEHLVRDGEVIEFDGWRLRAVATPGHTPGHLCVYEERHGLMFTGDHVLSRITPNVSLGDDDERIGRAPLAEFLDSLERVAAFDVRLALPAHEDVIEDLPARCAEIARHHDDRLEEVFAGIGGERATASEVSTRVTWNRPYEGFNVFKKRAALGETLAHLQLLEERGRVRRHDDGARVRWSQVGAASGAG